MTRLCSYSWILEAEVVYTIRFPRTSLLPTRGASDPQEPALLAGQVDSAPSHPLVTIARYSASPVGGYTPSSEKGREQLIFDRRRAPGAFDLLLFSWPFLPPSTLDLPRVKKHVRVTRAYSSTPASLLARSSFPPTYARTWLIPPPASTVRNEFHLPTHLAQFSFTPLRRDPLSTFINISPPPSTSSVPNPAPFFSTITIPFGRTLHLPPPPPLTILQPPLPASNTAPPQPHWLSSTWESLTAEGSQATKFYPALVRPDGSGGVSFGDGVGWVEGRLEDGMKCLPGVVGRGVQVWAWEGREEVEVVARERAKL